MTEQLRIAQFSLNERHYPSVAQYKLFLKSTVAEHRGMTEAITTHNVKLAERMVRAHTLHTQERFKNYLGDSLSALVHIKDSPKPDNEESAPRRHFAE